MNRPQSHPIVGASVHPLTGASASPIGVTAPPTGSRGCCPTGETGAPNLSNPFQYRLADCAECGGTGEVGFLWSDGFPDTQTCEDCAGTGETDAACCVCNEVKQLDDDGYCRDCLAPSIIVLEARSIGGGNWRIEL